VQGTSAISASAHPPVGVVVPDRAGVADRGPRAFGNGRDRGPDVIAAACCATAPAMTAASAGKAMASAVQAAYAARG
jgi:hypothetical protein